MSIRLIHISDPHFGGEHAVAAEGVIAAARDLAPRLVVVTGDLTLGGRKREFATARDWLAQLPQPVLATPGNHDAPVWNVPLRILAPFGRYRRYIGSVEVSAFESSGLIAHALNTARGLQPRLNWSHGAIDLEQVNCIAARMAAAPRPLKVVACHHPLIEIAGAQIEGGVWDGRVAARILASSGVDLILTGHLHIPYACALPYGAGRTYQCGAGTLSGRTRGAPPSYSVIEADRREIVVTAFLWSGAGFDPFETWTFPRAGKAEREAPAARRAVSPSPGR